ncbi:hypothetical protein JB92DRAFT_2747842 [Gautieria morchelliformis]|nr:hypothetical protein JB92DRAFT_2747842 [Gautieria morchelliformis]
MSAAGGTPTQTQPLRAVNGNDGGGRKHRGHNKGRQAAPSAVTGPTQAITPTLASPAESEDGTVCWICAELVKIYSLSECNHRTCHVCALRLRALYKRMDCTFCKYPQTTLVFTRSPDDVFASFTPERIPFKDNKLSIFFESQDMMEETLILLRFNCPDSSCDFTAHGWGDLKMHVRGVHGKSLCDMCIRYKKIFAHEHLLYQPSQLPLHLPSIPHRQPKSQIPEKVEGGVHPMCQFCRDCYFGDDELFAHMRERHEECFLCKRDGVRDQYFKDYNSLEQHFNVAHCACNDPQCLAQKFVVFGSVLDLKAHVVEQHGGRMTARDRKDARRIDTAFDHNDSGESGSVNRRQGRNRAGERDREPPESGPPRSRRREAFGGALTSESTVHPVSTLQRPPEEDSNLASTYVDPVATERHTTFMARINALTSNSTSAVPAVKAAVQSYRSSESGPRDLISTVFNVVNRDLDGTASLMSSIVELLDDEDKRRELLAAWNGFKIEQQRQFPDLVPNTVGSEYAGVAGGRVLNVKHSAAVRPSSTQSPRQVWDRVAQAAASSSTSQPPPRPAVRSQERFPALAASRTTPAFRQSPHTTAWSAAGSSAPSSSSRETSGVHSTVASTRDVGPPPQAVPPRMSAALFPTLPSSGSRSDQHKPAVSGNQSLKHILGEATASSANAWSKRDDLNVAPPSIAEEDDDPPPMAGIGKGKKKKGKEKQTLFTFGTFPT